jgi:BlaI family penicillinase repressor
MAKQPTISDAEWDVMEVLWAAGAPLMANDVVERIGKANRWSPRTVKSLLNRLVKKRALDFEAEGKRYRYFPTVSRAECVRSRSKSFVASVFGGAVGPMLAHFVNEAPLTPDEIRELKEMLERRERKGR